MLRTMVRGLLATTAGFLIVTSLVTYGGIGIGILFFAAKQGIESSNVDYAIIGTYSLATAACLLGLGLLLLEEFTVLMPRFVRVLRYPVPVAISLLLVFHLLALLKFVRVDDAEIKQLFVETSSYDAFLVLCALILYFAVVGLTHIGHKVERATNSASSHDAGSK